MKQRCFYYYTGPLSSVIIGLLLFSLLGGCAGAPKGKGGISLGRQIMMTAESQVGTKYRFGGNSPKTGFDCSGLAWWSHRENGISIPRDSYDQFAAGKQINRNRLMSGDLLYFETYRKGASHVGIYDGKGGFIHSPNSRERVRRTSMTDSYYRKRYLGARRFW